MSEQAAATMPELCHTGCGAPAEYFGPLTGGAHICRMCFEGWREEAIVELAALKLRSVMIRAGASDEAISKALKETFGPR